MDRGIYVTTTIPYVNANPHVGFALELVQVDVIARYHRLLGRPVRFQTGTDENALKNVLAARAADLPTQVFVDRNAAAFRRLCEALHISQDDFVRTTEPRHRLGVERFWRRLRPGDLYQRAYRGLYCVGCEDFLLERDLVAGRCPDHNVAPEVVEEENWFFRLSAWQEAVERLLAEERIRVIPETRRNEVLAFVRRGLEDISVSRAASRAEDWGIPVPGDPSQVIYVWIDALVNYLSGPGLGADEAWRDVWSESRLKVHVIGKNVWKFHAVYWPALLLSAGLPPPDAVVVHGFLTENGRKISKSLGNTVDPFACIARFGPDAVRYYLLRGIPPFGDGDFTEDGLRRTYNTDLANVLGNLVSRLTTLCAKAGYRRLSAVAVPPRPEGYDEALARFEYGEALGAIWRVLERLNRDIECAAPWRLLNAGQADAAAPLLDAWLRDLSQAAYWLDPFLPESSARALGAIGRDPIVPSGAVFPRLTTGVKGTGVVS